MVTVKVPPFKCTATGCGQVLRVESEEADPTLASSMVFKAACPACARRFTVSTTTIVRVREGDGPHHDVPEHGINL